MSEQRRNESTAPDNAPRGGADALKRALKGGQKTNEHRRESAFNARRVSNYAATIAPLMSAVIKEPGLGNDEGGAARAVTALSKILREAVGHAMRYLDMDEDTWAEKTLSRPMAGICADAWVRHQGDVNAIDAHHIGYVFAEFTKAQLPAADAPAFNLFSDTRELAASQAGAMARLMSAFMWLQNLPNGARKLMLTTSRTQTFSHQLFERVRRDARTMTRMVSAEADPETRRRIYMQMLRDISGVGASALEACSRRLAAQIKDIAQSGDTGAKDAFRKQAKQAGEHGLLGAHVYAEIDAYTDSVTKTLKDYLDSQQASETHSSDNPSTQTGDSGAADEPAAPGQGERE